MSGGATYSIRRIYRKGPHGITAPKFCTVNAVLKFDSKESPQCVYKEKVATNLAQTLHTPNAAGIFAGGLGVHNFASLKIANPGFTLPDIRKSWIKETAKHYPDHVAALVAFDILIGNTDRYQNLKASLFTPHIEIFAAFDHSHALLHPHHPPKQAIALLHSNSLILTSHTFYGLIKRSLLRKWCNRIANTPDYMIQECCEFHKPINTVDESTQKALAHALIFRKDNLPQIARSHEHVIRSKP